MRPAPLLKQEFPAPRVVASALPGAQLATAALVIGAIAALYFGRDILMPMALAALLAFALEPLVTRLRRLGLPRTGSVLVVVLLALTLIGGFGATIGVQVGKLADNLPQYQDNLRQKIRGLRSTEPGGSKLDKASTALKELGNEITAPKPAAPGPARARGGPDDPLTVRMAATEASPLAMARDVLGPVLAPAGVIGLVVVFLVFMLLEQEQLRDRLIRLFGGSDMSLTTQALTEAAHRVSRYLLMQLFVNLSYGVPIGLGLHFIGVPNALLWGALAVVLRFVPYVGPVIAMLFPLALAVAVDPGWSMLWWTLGLFVALEVISNNVVEPLLYGASTGMSAVAIIASAIFWTTLWGPAGLLLATPLTVCLVVLGRYVPQLHFLYVLLGSAPALTPPERFYQRMLAGDSHEAVEIAGDFAAEHGMAAFHQEVALPALQLADADRRGNRLTAERVELLGDNVAQALAQLDDFDDAKFLASQAGADGPALPPVLWSGQPVLCVGGRTALDAAAAVLLAQALTRAGIGARTAARDALAGESLRQLLANPDAAAEVVVLVYLAEIGSNQQQQIYKRLRRHTNAPVLLATFDNAPASATPGVATAAAAGATTSLPDAMVRTFEEAVRWIDERARAGSASPMVPAPEPEHEAQRQAAVDRSGLLDTPAEDAFDRITQGLQQALEVPIALITLVDGDRQFWKSSAGLPPALCEARESPRDTSVCGHVVAANALLVVEDTLQDPRFANNPLLRSQGIRFYAGAPLRSRDGLAIGSLCVMDTRPRRLGASEQAMLQLVAQQVMQMVEDRAAAPPAPG